MNNEQFDELKRNKEKQVHAFKECFGTTYGKETLRALREEFYDINLTPSETLQFQVGQRDVIHLILTVIGEIT